MPLIFILLPTFLSIYTVVYNFEGKLLTAECRLMAATVVIVLPLFIILIAYNCSIFNVQGVSKVSIHFKI